MKGKDKYFFFSKKIIIILSHVRFKTIFVHVGSPDQTVDDQTSKFNSVEERRGLTYNKSFLLARCHSLQDKLSHNKILKYALLETSLNTHEFLYKLLKEKLNLSHVQNQRDCSSRCRDLNEINGCFSRCENLTRYTLVS